MLKSEKREPVIKVSYISSVFNAHISELLNT